MPENKTKLYKTNNEDLFKWFFIIILVWLIPSTLLWTGLYLFIAESCDRKDVNTLNKIETELENIAYDSSRERFFQKNFSDLFDSLKGTPWNPISNLQNHLDNIIKNYPKNSIDIYLFNGEGKILPTKGACEEYNEFLRLATMEFNNEAITEEHTRKIGKIIPNPILILKKVRDQKDRAIELGNPDRYSLCYFNYETVKQQSIGGILIFVHYNNFKDEFILSKTIPNNKKSNFGYIAYPESHLPNTLKNTEINVNYLNGYYKLNATNRFRRYSKLVCIKRLREQCLLIGAETINQPSWMLFIISGIIFFIVSSFFFKLTYKTFVTRTTQSLNTRQRIIWLYAVCFILPLIVGIIISSQYLMELKNSLLSEEEQKNYKRLSEIDSGFSRFTTSKLIEYRKRNEEFTKDVDKPEKIIDKLKELCSDNLFDSVHLISSESKVLLSSSLVSAEVRRHKDESKAEQDLVFNTWLDRHALITPIHMKNLYDGNNAPLFPSEQEKTESHKAFIKVFSSTSVNTIDYYNQSKNITSPIKNKATNLIIGAIIDSQSMGLFEAVKSNISKFTPLEAMKEKILAYLDIIPGKTGEAWYEYLILTNLDTLERFYLSEIFHDIKVRNSRVNRVFPEEDIRAISLYPFATCFPTITEYKNFEQTIKQSVNDSKTFTHSMKINNENCYISVLRCSYLRHYLLLKIFKEKEIENIYQKQFNTIIAVFIIILLMGLAFTRLITKNLIVPITNIVNGVNALANKDYNYNININSKNEFGIIANAFNETASTLKKLKIKDITDKYFPLDNEFRCGSYLVHTSRVSSNLAPSDYFDCLQLKQGTYAFISANFSGNDSESTHLMTMLKTAFITLMPNFPNNPETVMSKLDKIFEPYIKSKHIISCFIGLLDPTNESIVCTNAGQPYPILFDVRRKWQEFINLPSTYLGFGQSTNKSYRKHEINLRHKILVLYSHRATDITNKKSEDYGEKFIEIVGNSLRNDNPNPAESIVKQINKNSSHFPWTEDIFVITIQNSI